MPRRIPTVTEKRLKEFLGKRIWVEREGILGNVLKLEGEIKEGELTGILQIDDTGFYVKMCKTYWNEEGLVLDYNSFLDEPYRIRDRDIIRLKPKKMAMNYLVRISQK